MLFVRGPEWKHWKILFLFSVVQLISVYDKHLIRVFSSQSMPPQK